MPEIFTDLIFLNFEPHGEVLYLLTNICSVLGAIMELSPYCPIVLTF